MRRLALWCGVAAAALLVVGCGSSGTAPTGSRDYDELHGGANSEFYYDWVDLLAGQTIKAGRVGVKHDENYLWVRFETDIDKDGNATPTTGWLMTETHLEVAADLDSVPQWPPEDLTKKGEPIPGQFLFLTDSEYIEPGATSTGKTYRIPISGDNAVFLWTLNGQTIYIAAHAALTLPGGNDDGSDRTETGWAEGPEFVAGGMWATYFGYSLTNASTKHFTPQIEPGDFLTYTQGGWGCPANGSNPGSYRDANFGTLFPSGLVVGCTSNRSITLGSAAAIQVFLPQGGTPAVLPAQSLPVPLVRSWIYVKTVKGVSVYTGDVFAGQTVALALNVAANLGNHASTASLGALYVQTGLFAGKTVQQVLDEANRVLGGCPQLGDHTPAELNTIADGINTNFDNGQDLGLLGLTAP
ncbi:MAG: hypothetical protein HYU66_05920 [Armatimonadetes bacterium]|nr:hypothetical protein [Armatimonadota bacterium]